MADAATDVASTNDVHTVNTSPMSGDNMQSLHSSGNVFRDLDRPDAEVRQAKALLAAAIVKVLDGQGLATWKAVTRTGVAHAEFSRIRSVRPARFTSGRLLTVLDKLGQDVEPGAVVTPRKAGDPAGTDQHP